MEYFDVVDKNGVPTGEIVERTKAHREGYWHHTSHVWIVRRKAGRMQILLQMRCAKKDSFPGCYDISSAGHIPAGEDYLPSALRELKEELGVEAAPEELEDCGIHIIYANTEFYGEPFIDNQVSKVYLMWIDREADEFQVQKEEIDYVRWFDFEECMEAVCNHTIPNCIDVEELKLLEPHFTR